MFHKTLAAFLPVFVVFFSVTFSAAPMIRAADQTVPQPTLTPAQTKFFETKIRPVMVRECYGCHSKQAGQSKGGLVLDSQRAMHQGGDSGPAIVPGDLDSSLFYGAITHNDFVMPPKRKLTDQEIADFRDWILDGAPDPRIIRTVDAPKQTIDEETIKEAKESFWAYQTPQRVAPTSSAPASRRSASTTSTNWAGTTIDQFVEQKLADEGLSPSPDATAHVVLRRLCFDLVGLPPTVEQVAWFEKHYASDPERAIEHVVDSMLDSQQFGQRWGRHWLDVVRYAESTGREVNMTYPHAWRYRDYVIESFNEDKPFDRFIQEQIAGDLLPARDDNEWADNLIATTFLAVGTKNVNEQSATQFAADLADEQIDATTRVFLGTSVACARCHDHKFDPIRQVDYYAMAGVFRSTKTYFGNPPSQYGFFSGPQLKRSSSLILLPEADHQPIGKSYSKEELEDLKRQIVAKRSELSGVRRGGDSGGNQRATSAQMRIRILNELSALSAKLAVVDSDGNPRSYCMGVQDRETVGDAPLLVRGEIDQPSKKIPRGLPMVLSDASFTPKPGTSGRLELARWIGSDDNTLAARVMVNRIWHSVFGQGIVPTTEDFGMTGTFPSHPELLDHLAIEFVESGWSVKSMIRQMMLSRTYRMDSRHDVASHEKDPDNRMLWRANVKRLDAESIRDAMLSIAGDLDSNAVTGSTVAEAGYMRVRSDRLEDPRQSVRRSMESAMGRRRDQLAPLLTQMRNGSPQERARARAKLRDSVGRRQMSEAMTAAYQDGSLDSDNANHRSVYLPIVRDFVPRSLEVFDFADPSMVIGVRESSNTPNQALFMMNNPLTIRLSESFAQRVVDSAKSTKDQVDLAFQLAYGREPSSDERIASHRYLRDSGLLPKSALASFCQSLFAASEFRYLN